jgi:hypothetical protein
VVGFAVTSLLIATSLGSVSCRAARSINSLRTFLSVYNWILWTNTWCGRVRFLISSFVSPAGLRLRMSARWFWTHLMFLISMSYSWMFSIQRATRFDVITH